jgi:hypothetical protein
MHIGCLFTAEIDAIIIVSSYRSLAEGGKHWMMTADKMLGFFLPGPSSSMGIWDLS